MGGFLDVCRFNPTLGGTTDWTFSTAVLGYQSPAAAGVVNTVVYRYRAESADLSQWEVGFGAYNTATGVLSRTTVLFNSSATGTGAGQTGAGSKISFTAIPQVAVVLLAEDLKSLADLAWTTYTPTITAQTGTPTTTSATGRYVQFGKTVIATVSVTITNIGTAAGQVIASLPVTAAGNTYIGNSYESANTGKSGAAAIVGSVSTTTMVARDAAFVTYWANSNVVNMTVTYEAA